MWNLAFIIAGICWIITIASAMVTMFGLGMSDDPSQSSRAWDDAFAVFMIGTIISAGIAGSHYINLHW
jgi:hypothetical protein